MSGRIVDRGVGIETTTCQLRDTQELVDGRLFEELTMAEKRLQDRRKALLKQDTVNCSGTLMMAPVMQRFCGQDG